MYCRTTCIRAKTYRNSSLLTRESYTVIIGLHITVAETTVLHEFLHTCPTDLASAANSVQRHHLFSSRVELQTRLLLLRRTHQTRKVSSLLADSAASGKVRHVLA